MQEGLIPPLVCTGLLCAERTCDHWCVGRGVSLLSDQGQGELEDISGLPLSYAVRMFSLFTLLIYTRKANVIRRICEDCLLYCIRCRYSGSKSLRSLFCTPLLSNPNERGLTRALPGSQFGQPKYDGFESFAIRLSGDYRDARACRSHQWTQKSLAS